MQNLEQIRAANALEAAKNNQKKMTREAVNRLPAMIANNGLLAAAAFVGAKGDPAMENAMDAIRGHLVDSRIGRLHRASNAKEMIDELSEPGSNSSMLRRATGEALAYLAYLKRFASKSAGKDGN